MINVETDSDENNDEKAATCKRRKLKRRTASSDSLRTESRSTVSAGHLNTARSSKSPGSPSAQWDGAPGPYNIEPPLLLEGSVGLNSAVMMEFESMKQHNAYLSNELSKVMDIVKGQQDLMVHMCKQLAFRYNQPQFVTKMPPVYNPLEDGRPRPGPKDEDPARRLEPLEMGVLRRQIYELSNSCPVKREGFRRIVDCAKWDGAERIRINLDTLDTKAQWKLWHYAFAAGASLQTVLTAYELAASDTSKKTKCRGPQPEDAGPRPIISVASHECAERRIMAASCAVQAVNVEQGEAVAHAAACSLSLAGAAPATASSSTNGDGRGVFEHDSD
jgi:hypothetical protein